MDKCLARNANVKIFTLNRFTWNFLGLGLTCGASGSMASFSNLKNMNQMINCYLLTINIKTMTMFSHLFFSLEAVSKAHPFSSTKLMYPPSSPTLASHSSNFARRALALAASWQWIGHYPAPHREMLLYLHCSQILFIFVITIEAFTENIQKIINQKVLKMFSMRIY